MIMCYYNVEVVFMNKKMLIIIFLIFVVVRIFLFVIIPHTEIRLNGEKFITLEYGEEYEEKGASLLSCNMFNCNLVSENITISEILVDKLGTYEISYECENNGMNYHNKRYVEVIDSVSPEIKLIGKEKIYLKLNSTYREFGAETVDNYDGDLTENITIKNTIDTTKANEYSITYSVKDKSNNESKIDRKIIVYDDVRKDVKDSNNEQVVALIDEIDSYIKNNHLSISVLYRDIINGYTYTYNPNKVYYGCSLIKTLDAMYVYENMEVTDYLRNNVKKAIEVSDNDAHYRLVNAIGKSKLAQYGKELGAKYTLTTGDYYGNTTVYDQEAFMKHLFQLLNTLSNADDLYTFFSSNFKKYMNFEGAPNILHKFGRISGRYFHDSAIILDDNPYILSILTQEDDKKYIITELSKKFYKLHHLLNDAN